MLGWGARGERGLLAAMEGRAGRADLGLPAGECELSLGVVDPSGGLPAVRLAIAGRADDGRYPLSGIRVRAR